MGDEAAAARQVGNIGFDVLWVGMAAPAMSALPQRGARVQQVSLEQGLDGVAAHAPDLVVLNVDTAQAADQFAHALQQQRAGSTTPVIVLCDDDAVAPLQAADRSGIVARLEVSVSGDELARTLDAQRRTQAEPSLERRLPITSSDLDDWVALAEKKGVCGLVLAREASQVMVLGPGGATLPTPQRFRAALVAKADQAPCFLQLPATRVRVLSERPRTPLEGEAADLPEVRVAVLHPDRDARTRWQRHMASAGAEVLFDEVADAALPRLGESAPDLLVVHERALLDLTRAGCWSDVGLHGSALLVVASTYASELDPHELVAEAARMLATHASLQMHIADAGLLVERVESLGAPRWLREVQSYEGLVELRVHAPEGSARVRIDNGEVLEARYWPRLNHSEPLLGSAALAALLEARAGRLIAGPPQRVADADRDGLPEEPPLVAPHPSDLAHSSPLSECGALQHLVDGVSLVHADEGTLSVLAATPASGMQSSADSRPPMLSSLRPSTHAAAAFLRRFAGGGATARSRTTAMGALALAAVAAAALWFTAPAARFESAITSTPAHAAERSALSASETTSSPQRAVSPAALAPFLPVAGPAADITLSAARPAADVALSAAPPVTNLAPDITEAAAESAPSLAEPAEVHQVQALPPSWPPAATETAGPADASPVGNAASNDVAELPSRLRRWLKPTAAQQRVIDAFWARAHKDFGRAERLLAEAHTLDPTEPEVAYQRALTYARQGRLEQTLSWAREAKQLSPLDPGPHTLEGDIQLLRGQRLEAEQSWKQCLRVRPGFPACVRRLEQLESSPSVAPKGSAAHRSQR